MATDVQLLSLSEGKSNILPSDLIVPFHPSSVPAVNAGSEEFESWRWYLATVRSLPQSTKPETYQVIIPSPLYRIALNPGHCCKDRYSKDPNKTFLLDMFSVVCNVYIVIVDDSR
jgi:hypothetical protein